MGRLPARMHRWSRLHRHRPRSRTTLRQTPGRQGRTLHPLQPATAVAGLGLGRQSRRCTSPGNRLEATPSRGAHCRTPRPRPAPPVGARSRAMLLLWRSPNRKTTASPASGLLQHRRDLSIEPDGIPVGIVQRTFRESSPYRIGNDVSSDPPDILVSAKRVVVKTAIPDSLICDTRRVKCACHIRLEAVDHARKRFVTQLQQAMPVIRHQHPRKQTGISPRCRRMDYATGDPCTRRSHKQALTAIRRRGQQIDLPRNRHAPMAQDTATGGRKGRHVPMLPASNYCEHRQQYFFHVSIRRHIM